MTYIHAKYCGMQDSFKEGVPSFALWTILEPVGNHPVGSTLAIQTLRELDVEPVDSKSSGWRHKYRSGVANGSEGLPLY